MNSAAILFYLVIFFIVGVIGLIKLLIDLSDIDEILIRASGLPKTLQEVTERKGCFIMLIVADLIILVIIGFLIAGTL